MDLEKANTAAAALTTVERAKQERLTRAATTTRRFMDRLRVGAFTLVGAYFGWRVAVAYFGSGPVSLGLGFLVGIVVTVSFPGRKP